jgi:divalent metal cation (Fe/Co/Zn/Cd) transporter
VGDVGLRVVAPVLELDVHAHPELFEVEAERSRSAQAGVIDVPDLFAIVVGPSNLVVDGDVTLDDSLTVPDVEALIDRAAAELRTRWPQIHYVYVTPVAERRPRGVRAGGSSRMATA